MQENTIVHEGRNVKRLRELLGIKQETIAIELDISQQAVSALEQKEALDKEVIEKIAKVLKIPAEAIKNFTEESVVNIISNNFSSHDTSTLNAVNPHCNFNSVDNKVIELFERLLASEKEKVDLMKEILGRLGK